MWKQKRRRSSTALQNMTCGIASNIGSIVCSCVSTQKGTILKVITVDFLNLLNRKGYRHSFVFFVLDLVYPTVGHNRSVDSERYKYRHIYKADENGLFFRLPPSKTLNWKGDSCNGWQNSKHMITVLLADVSINKADSNGLFFRLLLNKTLSSKGDSCKWWGEFQGYDNSSLSLQCWWDKPTPIISYCCPQNK